ncbi:superoxide dismutase family protein [Aliidiomarina minuta]|uniref:Superoxide dismutase family protein n=1 Tax=Aliidiomarina minuta TaxID=880057 RepID=A0A432W3I3_9GAMM|nr:superoxide dismutase family protein [Aliidiomarina minuta]RUO23829.1 superoxide dismutase family protein [Aliidiomarina minuta]
MKKLAILSLPLLLSACSQGDLSDVIHQAGIEQYVAAIESTEGNQAAGTVTFTRAKDGIHVMAHVEGLEPNQQHGFHIHEYGDCGAPDGTSAGGHFNPTSSQHGGPHDDERHVGDLGNLEANDQGIAHLEYIDIKLAMDGPYSVLGRGVVVHAEEDDLDSQPTGQAGARIGCGVIGVAASPD